ncbi:cysteine hydrolase family protein [Methylobacterium oxalidis]|uniref:cysteine hydrolase family protein n=1 Tax=Methylobacterium oxalidis TaxID=944322 RepID=UPI0011BE385A|nr:isochorismatase family cysteine hydrolase [Methylobacterium oxalidis]GJE31299.1 Peroxyureidoacrylate/ureidoacrylate amidohydrolase RutB [Methylobacterium oxalidis]
MAGDDELRFGALGDGCVHLCVDMQRMFAEHTDWCTPWMPCVLPKVEQIVEAQPRQTVFTRFIPAQAYGHGEGTWKRYYERWASMTIERLGPDRIELVPELARFVPPAETVDKHVYSPWVETGLHERLRARGIDTLVVTGGETDVCVLSTVLGAVDRGYRIVIVTDGLCSSSDEAHDAMLTLYHSRYGQQVETVTTDTLLQNWV